MASRPSTSACTPGQETPCLKGHMSLMNCGQSVCQCGTCSIFYNMSALSPAMSACSSLQDDLSLCGIWSPTSNNHNPEFFQSPFDGAHLETPPATFGMVASPDQQPTLDSSLCNNAATVGFMAEAGRQSSISSSGSDSPFPIFEPLSTIASRNEVSPRGSRAVSGQAGYRYMLIKGFSEKEGSEPRVAESVSSSSTAGSGGSQYKTAVSTGRA
jgi:hypothetical protein